MSAPSRRLSVLALALAPWLATLGCSGGDSGTPSGGAGTGGGDGVVGTFRVGLDDNFGAPVARVLGLVQSAPKNELTIWEQAAKDGACVLLKPRVPFCSTPCGSGNECVEDDTCKPEPTNKDVGTVTLTGAKTAAGATEVQLTSPQAGTYTTATAFMYPPFDEGAAVSISVASGPYGAFSAQAKGIAPLVVPAGDLPFEKDKAFPLTWTAKGAAGDSTIHVVIDISHHGGKKGEISCDTADSGSLTVSASLVTQLINLGVAGFPVVRLTRVSAGSTKISLGTIRFQADHVVERALKIPGITSCSDDTDCPTGQTCQDDLQCK
jgi:hypothetical protein